MCVVALFFLLALNLNLQKQQFFSIKNYLIVLYRKKGYIKASR
jgi:hypothetical protein